MRVLIIASGLNMGGIENMLLSSIPYYNVQGVKIDILCKVGGELDKSFIEAGVNLIDFERKGNPLYEAYSLNKILKKKYYDIVHSQYSHNSGFFAIICKLNSVPFFISVHNQKAMFKLTWEKKFGLKAIRKMYLNLHKYLSIKNSEKIIGHSNANLKYYTQNWERFPDKYYVVSNGIDFSKLDDTVELDAEKINRLKVFKNISSKVFIHIGSFKEQKNHSFLIEVFNDLNPKRNNYKLILLGTGELFSLIQKKINELELEDYIYMTGMETNIKPYMEVSDMFLFPSLYEGFGNVLIEAQYMRLPIVASDITPHYEAVNCVYHDYFFDLKTKSDALSKIKKMINEFETKELLEKKEIAYQFAKNFSVESMVNDIVMLYNICLNKD
ncbi:glycosyltransferase [Flavobacterium aestuarii]|uniref:glycosyltransferase n=1 Tax=Flavobacterium aestuarii TaxID=3149227 RepID=UPI0032B3DCAF